MLLSAFDRPSLHSGVRALLLVLCGMVTPLCHAKDQVPDWVRAAAGDTLPTYPAKTDAVLLLEDTAFTIAPDGSRVEHVREAYRILRPSGRKYADLHAWYRTGTKLRYIHLWSIGPDGREYAVKDNELTESGGGGGFELYSDTRARGGRPPAADPGAVVAMEYEEQEQPFDNDLIWFTGHSIPVRKERLTVAMPDGFNYRAHWKGKEASKAVDLEHGRTLWEVSDQTALLPEEIPLAPDAQSLSPRLDVFYYGSSASNPMLDIHGEWKNIGEWFERLAAGQNAPDAALTAKAQELTAGKTDFRDRVEAIADFVQGKIRYVAIEIGVGGYQPHAAADIFRVRYGDCKDKATLLSAMLKAAGIRSTWVLVDTERGVIDRDAPSLVGNHMIGAIELPEGYKPDGMYSIVTAKSGKRFLLFDPTWEKTPFGDLERELQGGDALLVDGADSQAIRMPVLAPERNTIERKAEFQLAADGTLNGTVHEQETGDIARNNRYLFSNGTGKEQQERVERQASRDMLGSVLTELHANDVADLRKPLTLSYAIKADHFAQEMGPLLSVRPRVLGDDSFPVDTHRRELPIDMGRTKQVHDDFTIQLPPGFTVDELPRPVNLDVGFATYRSQTRLENNALHYSRTYTVREITLPPERYPDVQKLARTIAGDEQSSAVLKRTN